MTNSLLLSIILSDYHSGYLFLFQILPSCCDNPTCQFQVLFVGRRNITTEISIMDNFYVALCYVTSQYNTIQQCSEKVVILLKQDAIIYCYENKRNEYMHFYYDSQFYCFFPSTYQCPCLIKY